MEGEVCIRRPVLESSPELWCLIMEAVWGLLVLVLLSSMLSREVEAKAPLH